MGDRLIRCDVCVVGAGLVGAAFALALAGPGRTIVVLEPAPPEVPSGDWDARIYTLSPGSQSFLQRIGVWADLPANRLQPVYRMRVTGDRGAEIRFSSHETGLERLATTVESGRLQHALWRRLSATQGVRLLAGTRPQSLEHDPAGHVVVRVADASGASSRIDARLLVGADGAKSWVREAAGIAPRSEDFGQVGVVANLATARPHEGTAYQWFRRDGIVAWLPLPGERISIVWSTSRDHAEELLGLTPGAFGARVAAAGGGVLGELNPESSPRAFPLKGLSVSSTIAPRIALIGDAAHVVHPLAGQGVNLGFGDAEALARAVSVHPARDPGERLLLRGFERSRVEAILAMRLATRGLHGLFGSPLPAVAALRNFGLELADRVPVLKTLLVRGAAG